MTCAWPNVVTFPVAKTFPRLNTLFVVTEFETYAFPLRIIVVAPACPSAVTRPVVLSAEVHTFVVLIEFEMSILSVLCTVVFPSAGPVSVFKTIRPRTNTFLVVAAFEL